MFSEIITINFGNGYAHTRDEKGKSLLKSISNYVVLDLETTGLDPTYDHIIELATIKIRNNEVVDKFQTLVNPGIEIDWVITELTGITNAMLANEPILENVLQSFIDFISDDIVIAHNANFDINFLYDACIWHLKSPFKNDFIDTMRVSRRMFKDESHHRLCDLVERFGIGTQVEHRALGDSIQTGKCYEYMKSYAEAHEIEFSSLYPVHTKIKAIDMTTTNIDFNEDSPIYGKGFVFTGALEHMQRKDAMQLVVDAGGICADGVTSKTNYLVLGNQGYHQSLSEGKSRKHLKADKLKLLRQDIDVISENVFFEMLAEFINEVREQTGYSTIQNYQELRAEIKRHIRLYYEFDTPEISDSEYDELQQSLRAMEKEHPEFKACY
jgi:DNA polymerase-3 subunit epsilon